MRAVADKARKDQVRSDGRCLHVQVVARNSYQVADALSAGTRTPDHRIWLPDSDLRLDRVEARARASRSHPETPSLPRRSPSP
ncbi:hypothetical protein [Streptomyces sp. NBC_00055]|uniref:hypothetical protein n=1 Tax=Streptomyces sp. NBC_00055 TaxID=2975632 RepID=UPI0038700118